MHFTSSSQSIIDTLHNNAKVAYIEAAAFGSSDSTLPFWLKSNQYGIVPTDKFSGSLRLGLHQNFKKSKFEFGYGLNVVGNFSKKVNLLLPESFIKLKYGWFDFYAGRKRETFGLADKTLSSGSYIWSGDRKSTRLNSSHRNTSRMPSSA